VTRVLVAVPWRAQPHREYAYDLTTARYRELLPEALIVNVDTRHEPFCLAACRNEGVRISEALGYDLVVLGDADTLPEPAPLLAAIEGALTSGFVHLPYTEYRSLRADGTAQYQAGTRLEDCNHVVVPYATSGVYVTTPTAWWASGGQDERFQGWGPEDFAWLITHRALLGADPVRHEGRVYALHHEDPAKDGPAYDAAVELYQRYLEAGDSGEPEAVRAIVNERLAKPQVA
jgi:hypothetical protein